MYFQNGSKKDVEFMVQEEQITASYHGERCRHNGENPNYELACDECPDYMICFPDWQYLAEKYDCSNEKNLYSIKMSSDEDLQAYLQANAAKDDITEIEKEIDLLVSEELRRRKGLFDNPNSSQWSIS